MWPMSTPQAQRAPAPALNPRRVIMPALHDGSNSTPVIVQVGDLILISPKPRTIEEAAEMNHTIQTGGFDL